MEMKMTNPADSVFNLDQYMFNTFEMPEDNDVLVLHEKVDLDKINYVVGLQSITGDYSKDEQIRSYLRVVQSNTKNGRYSAHYAKATKWGSFGRVFPYSHKKGDRKRRFGGCGVLKGFVRGFLAEDNYIDVDMVSCHWNLLRHEFKRNHYNPELVDAFLEDYSRVKRDNPEIKPDLFKILNSSKSYLGKHKMGVLEQVESLSKIHDIVYGTLVSKWRVEMPELYAICEKSDLEKTNGKNASGSFVGMYLQTLEYRVINRVYHLLRHCGVRVDCFIHDGFWVDIEDRDKVVELFPHITDYLATIYDGLRAEFVIKPFPPHTFVMPDTAVMDEVAQQIDEVDGYDFFEFRKYTRTHNFASYGEAKRYILQHLPKLIYLMDNGNYLYKEGSGKVCIQPRIPLTYIGYYRPTENGVKLMEPTLESLIKRPDIHRSFVPVKGITFDAERKSDGQYYNLFRGLVSEGDTTPLTAAEMERVKPWIYHLQVVLSNNNSEFAHWLTTWCRHKVLFPWKKTKTCPVFYSRLQQVGKNTFWKFFNSFVIGDRYSVEVNSVGKVTMEFNMVFQDKLMCIINESSTENSSYVDWNKMKDIITNEERIITPKGVDSYKVRDQCEYAITTNEETGIKLEDGNARYAVVEVNNCHANDRKYFDNLYNPNICYNLETGRLFYRYLVNYKTDLDVRDIPQTNFSKHVLKMSRSNVLRFCDDILLTLDDEHYTRQFCSDWDYVLYNEAEGDKQRIRPMALYRAYVAWCKDNGERSYSNKFFGSRVKTVFDKVKTSGKLFYVLKK